MSIHDTDSEVVEYARYLLELVTNIVNCIFFVYPAEEAVSLTSPLETDMDMERFFLVLLMLQWLMDAF